MDIVTPQEVLRQETRVDQEGKRRKVWVYKGEELTPAHIDGLRSEAEIIMQTSLWKMLISEGKYHAQKRAIITAKEEKDDAKKLAILKEAHAYHEVVIFFETFVSKFTNK